MSVSTVRAVQDVDISEFERRLRTASSPLAEPEDPLTELARLVGGDVASARKPAARTPETQGRVRDLSPSERSAVRTLHAVPAAAALDDHSDLAGPRPVLQKAPDSANAPRAADGGLLPGNAPSAVGAPQQALLQQAPTMAADASPVWDGPNSRRSGRWWSLKTAVFFVIGTVGLAGAYTMKGRLVGGSGSPPVIMAASGPTKVQAPAGATENPTTESASVLTKEGPTRSIPIKIVNNKEEPVDLAAQGGSPVAPTAAPIVPVGAANALADSGPSIFPDANKVKTIPVRPDGSLVGDLPAAGASRALEAPKAEAPVKTSTRIVAKADPAPAPVASQNGAGQTEKVVKPEKVAKAEAAAEPVAEGAGGFAVQLGAPHSESDARKLVSHSRSKFGDELGESKPRIRKAEVDGHEVYRVRVGGLSRAEADTLCGKLRAKGGDAACFVVKN